MKVGVLAIMMAIVLPFAAAAGPFLDEDSDGVADGADICLCDGLSPSPCADDTDADGYGNRCDGDFNDDGVVTAGDAPTMIADLNDTQDTAGEGTDMNCDGVVTAGDAGLFLAQLAATLPGPSGPNGGTAASCP